MGKGWSSPTEGWLCLLAQPVCGTQQQTYLLTERPVLSNLSVSNKHKVAKGEAQLLAELEV